MNHQQQAQPAYSYWLTILIGFDRIFNQPEINKSLEVIELFHSWGVKIVHLRDLVLFPLAIAKYQTKKEDLRQMYEVI